LDFPAELVRKAQNDGPLSQMINEERSLLSIRVEAMKTQIESLEQNRTLYEREIEAVSRQIAANRVQYDSVGNELKDVKVLARQGLATATRQMNLERTQAQIEMNEQGFQTMILRARQSIAQVDQKVFDLKSERNAKLTAELQQTRMDLDEVGIKFETNQSLLVESQLTVPTLVGNSDGVVEARSLVVVRVLDGKAQSIEADENTELLPGDVLRVQRSIIPTTGLGMERLGPRSSVVTQTKAQQ
jgi:polysaccharide biosynthesis/export protein ExoF